MSIVFLFGSGADTDCCSELKSGQAFSKALLREKYQKEVKNLLGDEYGKFKLVYPTSSKVFVQTVVTCEDKAKKVLDPDDIAKCISYSNNKESVDYGKDIKPIVDKWYNALTKDKEEDRITREFFLENAVFFDSLDEKFNSLRHKEHNDSAKRVMNAYATIFVFMLGYLYNLDNFEWNFKNVFNKLQDKYDCNCSEASYYRMIKNKRIDYHVATTNYTDLAEIETGAQDVIYLHGKLTWFEDLENLRVYDCTRSEERNHLEMANRIVPFILIPSGVKPLICTKQIKQFSTFIDVLEKNNELCIVGYRFNTEDNHINSIIATWLEEKNHQLIYFNYEKCVDFSKLNWVQGVEINTVEYNETQPLSLTHQQIQCINITRENSHRAFEEYLKMKEEEQNR